MQKHAYAHATGEAGAVCPGSSTENLIASLTEAIVDDSVLATVVLQAANSAHYAAREKITTVERAVVVLGVRAVCEILFRREDASFPAERAQSFARQIGQRYRR